MDNKTINIPTWVAKRTDLNWNEKALYSVYYYFTFIGTKHYCVMKKAEIIEMLGMNQDLYERTKTKLSKKGWIETTFSNYTIAKIETAKMADNLPQNCGGELEQPTANLRSDLPQNCGAKAKTYRKIAEHNREKNKEINKDNTYNISTYIESEETDYKSDLDKEREKVLEIRSDIDNGVFSTIAMLETRLQFTPIISGGKAEALKKYYYSKCQ